MNTYRRIRPDAEALLSELYQRNGYFRNLTLKSNTAEMYQFRAELPAYDSDQQGAYRIVPFREWAGGLRQTEVAAILDHWIASGSLIEPFNVTGFDSHLSEIRAVVGLLKRESEPATT